MSLCASDRHFRNILNYNAAIHLPGSQTLGNMVPEWVRNEPSQRTIYIYPSWQEVALELHRQMCTWTKTEKL